LHPRAKPHSTDLAAMVYLSLPLYDVDTNAPHYFTFDTALPITRH